MTDLKPCPFCGGEPRKMMGPEYWIECQNCHAASGFYNCIEHAIPEWNKRISEEGKE